MTGPRQIGTSSAVCLVIANMVGAGVFTTSGFALADLHSPERVLLAWLCGGILALAGAMSYGALARQIPESGGEYTFLAETVHPFAGFLAGWVSLLGGFTAPIAAAGLTLQEYLLGAAEPGFRAEWIGTGAITIACLAHLWLRPGIQVQNAAVAVKILLLIAFAAGGGWMVLQAPTTITNVATQAHPFEITSFATTLVWITFAYSGWNAAVYIGGMVRNPKTALPRALWIGTSIVVVVYLAVNAVFLYAVPYEQLAGRADVAAVAAIAIGGAGLGTATSLVVALALFTSISAMVMAGPRVYAKMAKDGVFPAWLDSDDVVPVRALLFQGALAIAVLWSASLIQVLGYVGLLLGLSSAATVASLIGLRLRKGTAAVPIPGYPWIPLGFVLSTLAIAILMAARDPSAVAIALGSVVAGAPIYFWMKQDHGTHPPHPNATRRALPDSFNS